MDVDHRVIIIADNPGPGSGLFSNNDFASLDIETDTSNGAREDNALQMFQGTSAAPEVGGLASSDGEDRKSSANVMLRRPFGRQGNHLAGADLAIQDLLVNDRAGGQIQPAKSLVTGSHEDIWIISPADELDGALVNTNADFKTGRGRDSDWGTGGGLELGEVKHTQLLFHAASGHEIRIVRRISNGANNVLMLNGEQEFAGVRVPDFAAWHLSEMVHMNSKQDAPTGRAKKRRHGKEETT